MADKSFILALDIVARPGKRAVLIAADRGTSDYSIYEIAAAPQAAVVSEIIHALCREIEIAGEKPVAIETDSSIIFSDPGLGTWLSAQGIEHRFTPIPAIVEALIRQHSPEWES